MNEKKELKIQIKPEWKEIKIIQKQIIHFLNSILNNNEDLVEATEMSASELIENAIKYGNDKSSKKNINFNLSFEKDKIIINVKNDSNTTKNLNKIDLILFNIKNCDNSELLYISKLKEIFHHPDLYESQLGFYRIAYEGKFNLDYSFDNHILSITATRYLNV